MIYITHRSLFYFCVVYLMSPLVSDFIIESNVRMINE
jgi:hypothetical protein